jgi:hypothetical protein
MISAFTQGNIDVGLYINQPEGHISKQYPTHVLKLLKALYGLKQSARIWINTLKEVLINKLGFKTLVSEPSLFINKTIGIIIYIYIDDLVIINPTKEIYNSFIDNIKRYFKIKELGLIKNYLNVQIDYKLE